MICLLVHMLFCQQTQVIIDVSWQRATFIVHNLASCVHNNVIFERFLKIKYCVFIGTCFIVSQQDFSGSQTKEVKLLLNRNKQTKNQQVLNIFG